MEELIQTPYGMLRLRALEVVSKLKGSAKSVVIRTHELAGPNGEPFIEERIHFPAAWDVHVQDMAGHSLPALTQDEIAAQGGWPIGTKSVRELAEGKKTVAIRFDDLANDAGFCGYAMAGCGIGQGWNQR